MATAISGRVSMLRGEAQPRPTGLGIHASVVCESLLSPLRKNRDPHSIAPHERMTSAHGSPLCQDTAGRSRLAWLVVGLGSGLSEGAVLGVGPVTLGCRVVPECPSWAGFFALSLVGDHAGVDAI